MNDKYYSLRYMFPICTFGFTALMAMHAQAETTEDMSIHYGRVTEATPVDVKNHVGEGAMVGGLLGTATAGMWGTGSATGNVLMGSTVGAATGAAIEYFGESRMKGTRYTVESVKEGVLHIITDQRGVHIGDCVAIEATSKHANLRQVSDVYCETASVGVNDSNLDSRAKQLANDCYEAKRALLGAETKEQVEQAKRRVRANCDT